MLLQSAKIPNKFSLHKIFQVEIGRKVSKKTLQKQLKAENRHSKKRGRPELSEISILQNHIDDYRSAHKRSYCPERQKPAAARQLAYKIT